MRTLPRLGVRPTFRWRPLYALVALLCLAITAACGGQATPTPTPTASGGQQPTPTEAEPTPTPSFDAEAYFRGKTVRVISPAAAGGGYDIFARMFASVAPRHLPGNPNFVVENHTGSGLLFGLQVAMRAAPDGLTIGQLHPRWAQAELLGQDVEGFDLDSARILGSPTFAAASSHWCIRSDIAKSWDEILALGRPVTSGETAPGNSPGPEFVEAIGGPIRNVYGYGGSSEIMAAFDRRELDGTTRCGPELVLRLYPNWVDSNFFTPIFYYGEKPDPEWSAQFGVPDLPYLLDIVETTEDQRRAFEAYIALVRAQRVFLMPPGVPDDVYQVWLKAFNDTVNDPEFAELVASAGYADDYELGTAEQVLASFDLARGLSEESRDLLIRMSGAQQ